MKNGVFILFVCVLFFSCQQDKEANQLLDRIECLVETLPDSAYTLLNELENPDLWNDQPFARYCMLYSRTADKLYKDMLYTEQLNRALSWYQIHGTAEEQAWMGLYRGRSYAEDKLFIPAVNCYSDALELAKEKELYNVAGYICSYMKDLYIYTNQITEERRKCEEAAIYFLKSGNMRSYALALRDIAKTLVFQDSLDLALDTMLKADSIIGGTDDSVGISSVKNGLGNIYRKKGSYEKAQHCYLESLIYDDTIDVYPTYLALSNLFYQIDELDSARYYLEKTYSPLANPYTITDRLYMGYIIEEDAGNIEKALDYLVRYQEAKDSLYDAQRQVDIIDAEKRHNVVTLHRETRRLERSRYRLFTVVVVLCLVCVLIYQIQERRRLQKINEKQNLLEEKERQLVLLGQRIEEKDVALETLEQIRKERDGVLSDLVVLRNDKLQTSALVKKLRKQSQRVDTAGKNVLKVTEERNLILLIQSIYPSIAVFMDKNPFGLTEAEKQICYLSFLQLSLNEEAVLLDINPDSVNKRRLRAREKLNLTNTNMGLHEFLLTVDS
jgi:tetratricopeptide (TPR) repeat protein